MLKQAVQQDDLPCATKGTKWIRYKRHIADGYQGLYIPAALFDYRQHDHNMSGIGEQTQQQDYQFRLHTGGFYDSNEPRITMDDYCTLLFEQFGIIASEISLQAGGLQYAEKAGEILERKDGRTKAIQAVNLADHWKPSTPDDRKCAL